MPKNGKRMDELKPCPFCGSLEIDVCAVDSAYCMCAQCGAEGPWTDEPGDDPHKAAMELWNRRADNA